MFPITNAGVCAEKLDKPTLSEFISNNCDKAKKANELAIAISNKLFPNTGAEPGKCPNVTCIEEKEFETSIALEELLYTLNQIYNRL